LKFIYH
jgi:hypothetical protein